MVFSGLCWGKQIFDTDMFCLQLKTFRFLGNVISDSDNFKLMHILRGFLNTLICLFILIANTIYLFYVDADIGTATLVAAIGIVYLNLLLKNIFFYLNGAVYEQIFASIQKTIERTLIENDPDVENIYKSYKKNTKIMDTSFAVIIVSICTLVILGGMVFVGLNFNKIMQGTLNSDDTMAFIYIGFPFTLLTQNFIVVYVLPCYAVVLGGSGVFSWTTLIANFMKYASFQIDALNYELAHLNDGCPSSLEKPLHDLARCQLIKCTEAIISVKMFVSRFEKIIKYAIFVESTSSTALMCFLLYQMLQVQEFSTRIIMLPAVLSTLSILFLYYWNANEVMYKSDQISKSAYMSDWYYLPVEIQKDVLLLMKACVNPITISVCFFRMNTQSFLLILKTSYSYLTILTNLANQNDQ